ncbi:MAG: glycosyltransferase family 4 protein [Chloroflexaceae bacterium]|nr:glycosyltransferase family 4 protein [Chloroflexaceae bacterium]
MGEKLRQPVHIGIDASRLAVTSRTGTERYSLELLTALAGLDSFNRYTLYCNQPPAMLPPLPPNGTLRVLPFPRLWTHTRLSLEMYQHPPDILFVPAHVLPLYHPARSVVTLHDLGYLAFPEAHPPARRLELHLTTLWSARTARRIIAVSEATREALVHCYGIDRSAIAVVHHGLSPMFRPVQHPHTVRSILARCHCNEQAPLPPYLLFIGTVQPRKNLARLIDALALVVHRGDLPAPYENLHLIIVGKRGWLDEAIISRAAEQGIAERVCFAGYVADQDLPALLSAALAFVFPSLHEGFGMPVLEAMACGTPVLTSNTSSLPEVAGDAALLVNPHSTPALAAALVRLLNDTALRADLRERGLARAAQYTWERCARQTLSILLDTM